MFNRKTFGNNCKSYAILGLLLITSHSHAYHVPKLNIFLYLYKQLTKVASCFSSLSNTICNLLFSVTSFRKWIMCRISFPLWPSSGTSIRNLESVDHVGAHSWAFSCAVWVCHLYSAQTLYLATPQLARHLSWHKKMSCGEEKQCWCERGFCVW